MELIKDIFCMPTLASYAIEYDKKIADKFECSYIFFLNGHELYVYSRT